MPTIPGECPTYYTSSNSSILGMHFNIVGLDISCFISIIITMTTIIVVDMNLKDKLMFKSSSSSN